MLYFISHVYLVFSLSLSRLYLRSVVDDHFICMYTIGVFFALARLGTVDAERSMTYVT